LTVRACGKSLDSLGLPPDKLADVDAISSESVSEMLHYGLKEIEPDRGGHVSGNLQDSSVSSGLLWM
jgi:nicotinamide mononucleotide (NMN) deamidase PncC